ARRGPQVDADDPAGRVARSPGGRRSRGRQRRRRPRVRPAGRVPCPLLSQRGQHGRDPLLAQTVNGDRAECSSGSGSVGARSTKVGTAL
ncbi:MAG: hypothetical protein AVDCRST_MAG64-1559, partial [uncultured Phycisphaerae bacterium]